jgi:hypothetical protein
MYLAKEKAAFADRSTIRQIAEAVYLSPTRESKMPCRRDENELG